MKVAVQLGGSEFAKVSGDEGEANQVALAALEGVSCIATWSIGEREGHTWLKMSFWVSGGRSRKPRGLGAGSEAVVVALSQDWGESIVGEVWRIGRKGSRNTPTRFRDGWNLKWSSEAQ